MSYTNNALYDNDNDCPECKKPFDTNVARMESSDSHALPFTCSKFESASSSPFAALALTVWIGAPLSALSVIRNKDLTGMTQCRIVDSVPFSARSNVKLNSALPTAILLPLLHLQSRLHLSPQWQIVLSQMKLTRQHQSQAITHTWPLFPNDQQELQPKCQSRLSPRLSLALPLNVKLERQRHLLIRERQPASRQIIR